MCGWPNWDPKIVLAENPGHQEANTLMCGVHTQEQGVRGQSHSYGGERSALVCKHPASQREGRAFSQQRPPPRGHVGPWAWCPERRAGRGGHSGGARWSRPQCCAGGLASTAPGQRSPETPRAAGTGSMEKRWRKWTLQCQILQRNCHCRRLWLCKKERVSGVSDSVDHRILSPRTPTALGSSAEENPGVFWSMLDANMFVCACVHGCTCAHICVFTCVHMCVCVLGWVSFFLLSPSPFLWTSCRCQNAWTIRKSMTEAKSLDKCFYLI